MLRRIALLSALACSCAQAAPMEENVDCELKGVYDRAWSAADDYRKPLLESAQLAWAVYRQHSCEALRDTAPAYPEAPHWHSACLVDMAEARTAELRQIAALSPAKTVCIHAP